MLKRIGTSATGLVALGGAMPVSARRGSLSEADAEELLRRAARRDARETKTQNGRETADASSGTASSVGGTRRRRGTPTSDTRSGGRHPNISEALQQMDPETRAAVLEDKLAIEATVVTPGDRSGTGGTAETESSSLVQAASTENQRTISAYASLLYKIDGVYEGWVARWHQELEWGYDNSEITYADERYYSRISTGGQIDQWTKTNQNVADESGGEGDDRYRLFTTATYAMCFGVGPIQQCFNQTQIWVDMTVEADGGYDIDTSGN